MSNHLFKSNNKLATQPIKKLLISMAVPTVLAQLVQLLYNVVDRIYVGRIPESGAMGLAGLGVTFPILLLIAAFASMVGMGGAPRASIAMGKGDVKEAEKILGNSITLLIIFSVVLTCVFSIFKEPILLTFGASENSLPYAVDYISIYLLGTIFVQFTMGLNPFITNQGFSKTAMLTVCIGCGLNIILDPIFIFVLGFGVKGAAIATVISQGVSAIWVMLFLLSKKSQLKITKENLIPRKYILISIASLGISPFVMQSTECLIQLSFNRGMLAYGNDTYVAIMAILFSLNQIIFLPLNGIGQGATPIMSYNYGAKNVNRVKETYRLLFISSLSFSLIFVGVMEIFPEFFIGLFSPDPTLIATGALPLQIFLCGMSILGAQMACQNTFLALGQAKASIFIATLRKIILLLPLSLILPNLWGLGIWGLFLAEPISDVISATTSVVLYRIKHKALLTTPSTVGK